MKEFIRNLALFALRKTTKSNYIDYAKREFIRAGWCDSSGKFDDDMQKLICENVTDLLCVMSHQGHSGFSAGYMLSLFNKLSRFEPISPITGADDEWMKVSDNTMQSNVYSAVFKDIPSGKAYWLEHYVFDDGEGCFTSHMSKQPISFPWVKPESIIVKVSRDSEGNTIYPDFVKAMDL